MTRSLTARTLAISGAFAVVLAAGFALLAVAIGSLREAGQGALRAQQAVTVGTELERSVVNLESGLRGYVATGSQTLLIPFDEARAQYPRHVRRLKALTRGDRALRDDVDRISAEVTDYVDLWALPLLAVARDDLRVARSVIGDTTGRARVQRIRAAFGRMFARARSDAAAKRASADRRSSLAITMGIVGIVLVLGLSGLLAWLLRRFVLRPIKRVASATETIAAGDLTARVPEDRTDELGDLARAFNEMASSLERSQAELARRALELERTNAELEDYASVTSHDLQGPLVTIGMYAGLLAQRLHDDDEARELAEHIRDGSARMRTLVRELLAYARLGRRAARQEPVALEGCVSDALDGLAGPLRDAVADVVVGDLPVVVGDPARLTQLFQNLVANAIKFTEQEPRVEIESNIEDGMACVAVSDNGIGFAPGEAELIFRPFQRLHTDERFEGTGIGLAVCWKIVEQHGGRIWADGRPGRGATFRFTLPLAPPAHAAESPGTLVGAGGSPT